MKYKIGQIVFFKGNGFFSKLIKTYNFINYGETGFSHTGIITKVERDRVIVSEALSNGFINTRKDGSPNYYYKTWLDMKKRKCEIDIKTPIFKLINVEKNTNKYIGIPYGFLDILGILISLVFKFRFISLTGAKRLICSEAVARILYDSSNKKINFQEEFNKCYDLISPMDIYKSKFVQ